MRDKLILHLNVKKKWFDMIKSGEKKGEYRDKSYYWCGIFDTYRGPLIKIKGKYYNASDVVICFSNGYAKDRPQFFIECTGLRLGIGKKEWGASGEQQFILSLGKIL